MAADKCRKRLSSNSIIGCSSRELRITKKRSLASLQSGLHMKPHVSLEFDGSQKRVVAKSEQIGLSRRDMRPYSNCVSYHHNSLADVITLPKEIFAPENLENVFSYEVWREYLSEHERGALLQFLPKGVDCEEVVKSLFKGSNFSFGNPVLNWSNMLASGNLHPDAIMRRDLSLLASQKDYCLKLQNYHIGMISNLQQLKEIWDGCQDPTEFVSIISRRSIHTIKSTFATTEEYKSQYSNQNFEERSESLTTMEFDKACSTDDKTVVNTRSRECQKRKGLKLENPRIHVFNIEDNLKDDIKSRMGEKHRASDILVDGAKYMAYIRITKKQLELLRSMKKPGKCIQSKSVNQVLGNLASYNAQPYKMFEEEEQRKLHDQWLLVVNTVPKAFANWRTRQIQKVQISQLLCQDIKENAKRIMETDQKCRERTDLLLKMEDEDAIAIVEASQDTMHQDTFGGGGFKGSSVDMGGSEEIDGVQNMNLIGNSHGDSMLDMSSENNTYSDAIRANYTHGSPDFPHTSTPFVNFSGEDIRSAAGVSWQIAKLSPTHQQSTLALNCISNVCKVPHRVLHSNMDCQPQFVDSESELHAAGAGSGTPHSASNQRIFSAYQNDDRTGLILQSNFSSSEPSSYKPHQRRNMPPLQPLNDFMENMRFPDQYQYQESLPQSHPLEANQNRDECYYMNQPLPINMHDLIRSGTGFSDSVIEQLPTFRLPDWHANSVGMPVPFPIESHVGGFSTQNWHTTGQQNNGGWTYPPHDASILNQSLRNDNINNDETLFSILSQCKELRSGTSYDHHMGSTGQVMGVGSFGVTGSIPRNNIVTRIAPSPDLLSGREVAPLSLPNSVGWVNMPQQTSSPHDPLGKPFLRSWNQ